jgi:hypothetical protein
VAPDSAITTPAIIMRREERGAVISGLQGWLTMEGRMRAARQAGISAP